MASKKSSPQSGTSNGNAPPFATKGGQPTNVSSGKPTDLIASRGRPNESAEGGAHDFIRDPTGTPGAGDKPRDLIATGNRPQAPVGTPADRVNERSIPKDGPSIPLDKGAVARGGTGTIGNPRVPFKGMK